MSGKEMKKGKKKNTCHVVLYGKDNEKILMVAECFQLLHVVEGSPSNRFKRSFGTSMKLFTWWSEKNGEDAQKVSISITRTQKKKSKIITVGLKLFTPVVK